MRDGQKNLPVYQCEDSDWSFYMSSGGGQEVIGLTCNKEDLVYMLEKTCYLGQLRSESGYLGRW